MAKKYSGFEHRAQAMVESMGQNVIEEYCFIQRSMIVKLAIGAQCKKCLATAMDFDSVLDNFVIDEVYPSSKCMDDFQDRCLTRMQQVKSGTRITSQLATPLQMIIDLRCSNCQHEGSINRDMDYTYVVGK